MKKNEFQEVITGMAQLGEIYLRVSGRIRVAYEKNPKLRFEASQLMTRAGYKTENYDLRKMVDDLLKEPTVIPVEKEERRFLCHYAEKYNDPVLTQEIVMEFIACDREERGKLLSHLEEQLAVFPDPKLGFTDLERFGYHEMDLFPVRREIAAQLLKEGILLVYAIHESGRKEIIAGDEAVQTHGGMFGIKRKQWMNYYLDAYREDHPIRYEFKEPEKEYRIYQWKEDAPDRRDYSFTPYDVLTSLGVQPDLSHYDLVYESRIRESATLDNIFEIFNLYHPDDFRGHSLSVGDVVAFKEADTWKAWYVDSFGFRELDDFWNEGRQQTKEQSIPEKRPGRSR